MARFVDAGLAWPLWLAHTSGFAIVWIGGNARRQAIEVLFGLLERRIEADGRGGGRPRSSVVWIVRELTEEERTCCGGPVAG